MPPPEISPTDVDTSPKVWLRDPDGPKLNSGFKKGAVAHGHSPSDFYRIALEPGRGKTEIWSRSMIKAMGENFAHEVHTFEPKSRVLRPWPVLKMPRFGDAEATLGEPDDGRVTEADPQQPATPSSTSALELIPEIFSLELTGDPPSLDRLPSLCHSASSSASDDGRDYPASPTNREQSLPPVTSYVHHKAEDFVPKNLFPHNHAYDTKGVPKLEETIPVEYLPDELLVHDPDFLTHRLQGVGPIIMKRLYPAPRRPTTGKSEPRVAHLYLSYDNRLGVGNHSQVYNSPIRLPPPLSGASPSGLVTVAAKVASPGSEARDLLHTEGKIYKDFPQWLSEDWTGFTAVPNIDQPVPRCAVVPKFYGYYVPVLPGKDAKHVPFSQRYQPENRYLYTSPILLVEACGEQSCRVPMTQSEKKQVHHLFPRLHAAGFTQGSPYARNMVAQRGPLSVPIEQRTWDSPSYRIIDFGRGVNWAKTRWDTCDRDQDEAVEYERNRSRRDLNESVSLRYESST